MKSVIGSTEIRDAGHTSDYPVVSPNMAGRSWFAP